MTDDEALALWDAAKREQAERRERIPDEATALRLLMDGWMTLREHGWREASYAPFGVSLNLIEMGSTDIHTGYRDDVGFWIQDDDTWPSRPVLFRALPPALPPSSEAHDR